MRKMKCCEYSSRDIFTALYFLHDLKMSPISWSERTRQKGLPLYKFSSFLGPFVRYKENEVM
jgi:hypothetical protein